jgi:hypothetical protein
VPVRELQSRVGGLQREEEDRMIFFWFAVAYVTAYKLGEMKGVVREREREERADRKAADNIVNIRDHR